MFKVMTSDYKVVHVDTSIKAAFDWAEKNVMDEMLYLSNRKGERILKFLPISKCNITHNIHSITT